jgi:putative SOS response-associated peptidase YedK
MYFISGAQDGTITHSFMIITLPASPLMAQIHNAGKREPAILSREDCQPWLSGTPGQAPGVLRQYPDDLLGAYAISKRVNSCEEQ